LSRLASLTLREVSVESSLMAADGSNQPTKKRIDVLLREASTAQENRSSDCRLLVQAAIGDRLQTIG
jgi:hypothetical protein